MKDFTKYLMVLVGFLSFSAFGQSVTLTSEPIAVGTVYPGEAALINTLKVHADVGVTSWQSITFSTSGTYTSDEVLNFNLYVSPNSSFTSASIYSPLTSATSTGSGEFLTFNIGLAGFNPINPIEASALQPDRYFFLVANLKPTANVGKTININAALNPAVVSFTPTTSIVNNQTNISGIQTIGLRALTLSTETVTAGPIYPDNSTLVYTMKVTSTGGNHMIRTITLPFTGSVALSDIGSINILENTVNDFNTASPFYWPWVPPYIHPFSSSGSLVIGFWSSNGPYIATGATKYIFVSIKLNTTTVIGSTFKINGSSGSPSVSTEMNPNIITNLQTDLAGIKTVTAPTLTHSTEILPALNVYKNQKVVIYKMKIDPGTTAATLKSLTVKTSGTYLATDITSFEIASGNSSTYTSNIPGTVSAPSGFGETISFTGLTYPVNSGINSYIYVLANIKNTATTGRIIKINGTVNPATLTYSVIGTNIINSQSDLTGTRVITSSNITYQAQSVPSSTMFKGSKKNVLYKAKISNTDPFVNLNSISFLSSGTYLTSDFTNFRLSITSTDDVNTINTSSPVYNLNFAPTNNGEIITFTNPLGSYFANVSTLGGDKYLWITADVGSTATPGRTIKLNALTNPTAITFYESPSVTNTLADIAGTQTIEELPIVLSTVATPASNIFQGEIGSPMYILRVDSPTYATQISSMNIATNGTYIGADMKLFALYYNTTNNLSTAAFVQSNWVSGGSPNLVFTTFATPVNIPAGQSGFFFVLPSIKSTAVASHTININGAANPVVLGLLNGAIPNITNNQTDVAGIKTIVAATTLPTPTLSASSLTYCSGNAPAGVTLTATSCPSPSQAVWFLGGSSVAFASTNGTLVVTPTVPSTYTVSCMGSGLNSGISGSVTITPVIINQPTGLTASPTFSPSPGSPVVLTATGCGSQTVVWDNLSTANPRTVTPSVDKVYSFRCSNDPCLSTGEASYALTIGPCLLTHTLGSPTHDVSSGVLTRIASAGISGKITATNKITGTAKSSYTARAIELLPGFRADTGTLFIANVGGCF